MVLAQQTIEMLVKKLPSKLQREVENFVRFLLQKQFKKHGKKLRQDWAGALRAYGTPFGNSDADLLVVMRDIKFKIEEYTRIRRNLKGIREPVAQTPFCHPELVSGSHNPLILLDAETSPA